MNKQLNFRFVSGILMVVLMLAGLAACGSQPSVPAPVQSPVATAAEAAASDTAAAPTGATQAPASATAVSFSKDILPIMETSCVSCHGGEKTSKGLDLKSYASLMAGSQNGAVITAGDAAASKLVASVQSGKMPKRGTKLTAEQLQLLVDWVNAGATNN